MERSPSPDSNVEEQLAELSRKYDDLYQRLHLSSATRVARESARLAKDNQRLVPYLNALFRLMNSAQWQFDVEAGKQAAVEAIAYLESADRARTFQGDLPEQDYLETVGWMSACAYDNLAKHTAKMQGYNSEGMHQCITDGISVCRRTGKLRCVTCFREYASDVYLASDDVAMALHFARLVKTLPEDSPGSERRWVGAKEETWITLLQGNLAAAEASAQAELKLAPTYHTPLEAEKDTLHHLELIRLLAGRHDEFLAQHGAAAAASVQPRGEWIGHDLWRDQIASLEACCRGDFKQAEELLVRWDRWLTERRVLHDWFEIRLRLIACHRLAGNSDRVETLAKQLNERAWKARDWLTLHRVSRLLDPGETPSPLALLGPLETGPFAAAGSSATVTADPPVERPAQAAAPPPAVQELPPLEDTFNQLVQRLETLPDDASRRILLDDVLAIPTTAVTHPVDAARLLHLLTYVLGDDPTQTRQAVWRWAQTIAAPFTQSSAILNLLAAVGDLLREDQDLAQTIDAETIERLFRESLDLDPFQSRNHLRASLLPRRQNLGEAERCLARGFRLERNFGPLALRLAEIYERTERPRDAMMVLDTCLREGCEDSAVAWQAALSAVNLKQYEPLLTYLDRHEQLQAGALWINYYRAVGLLELGRPQEALAAVKEEARRAPEHLLPLRILRACALQMLQRADEARSQLAEVLAIRLATVDYLTFTGLCSLFARLWNTVAAQLAAEDPLGRQLEQYLLTAGLAPDEFFEPYRKSEEERRDIHFYRCRVCQPLDPDWPSSGGCLPGQEQWRSYLALWGVLASDETEARCLVQAWQSRCASLPPAVQECEASDNVYTDRPGIVWQGQRWVEEP